MQKKCDCACHQLHPIPCMYCTARHDERDHDGQTERLIIIPPPAGAELVQFPSDDEGFPF